MKKGLTTIRRWFIVPIVFIGAGTALWFGFSVAFALFVLSTGASSALGIAMYAISSLLFFALIAMTAVSLHNNLERIESVDFIIQSLGGPKAVPRILRFMAKHFTTNAEYAKVRDAFMSFIKHHINRSEKVVPAEPERFLREKLV